MVGVHFLIGIGEGLITAVTVGAVVAVRPDLVYGAQDLVPALQVSRPMSHSGGRRHGAGARKSIYAMILAAG